MTNTELADIVSQLEIYQPNNRPPLTLEQFQTFEAALECSLPEDIRQLYLTHDGTDAKTDYHTLFLMPVEEVLELYDEIKHKKTFWQHFSGLTENTRFLWHERNSNYAGLYVDGPLAGKITLYNHEDENPAPVFRSITSFYRATLENILKPQPESWKDITSDYPFLSELSAEESLSDLTAALTCMTNYKSIGYSDYWSEKHGWLLCAIALMPPEETWRLLAELKNRMATRDILSLIGQRRYSPAVDGLIDWLIQEISSANISGALAALRNIGNEYGGQGLIKFWNQHTQLLSQEVARSLQICGYRVREVDGGYEYQAPSDDIWHKL